MIKYTEKFRKKVINTKNPLRKGFTYSTYWRIINGQYIDLRMLLKMMNIFEFNKLEDVIYYEKN